MDQPGHCDAPLDAAPWLPDSIRKRRKATKFALAYSKFLFPIIDPYDWGSREHYCAESATNERRNDWKRGRCEENQHVPYWQRAPKRLPIYRLDHHTRPGYRTPREKLLVTAGRRNGWLVAPLLDLDAHNGEPDAHEAFLDIRDAFFPDGLYNEEADRGWHGYPLFDRTGYSDAKVNDILRDFSKAIGLFCLARGRKAKAELKGTITEVDRRGLVVTRGGLCAPPRLPNDWDSLGDYRRSTIYPLSIIERRVAQLTRTVTQVVPDKREESAGSPEPARCRAGSGRVEKPRFAGSSSTFTPTTNDAHDLKLQLVLWLARLLRRLPTLAEALVYYNPLRDHAEDETRRRKMQATIEFVGRTFNPRKCRSRCPVGTWEENNARCTALVLQHVTADAYIKAGIPTHRRNIPTVLLAISLYSLMVKSFRREPNPKDQFTWGVSFIDGTVRNITGMLPNKQRRCDARHLLTACGLAECFDFDYFPTWGSLQGIARKYHIGTQHPDYGRFCLWADEHGIETALVRDLSPDERPPIKEREDITHCVPAFSAHETTTVKAGGYSDSTAPADFTRIEPQKTASQKPTPRRALTSTTARGPPGAT